MKKTSSARSAFFISRITAALFLSLSGVFLMLLGFGAFSNVFAHAFAPSKISLPDSGEKPAADQQLSPADRNGRFVYLVKFAEPGLLERRQDKTEGRFNSGTREAQGHRAELVAEQKTHLQAMAQALGRFPDVTHYFLVTHSGLACRLTQEEAQRVRTLPGVVSVERERLYDLTTYRGPTFIGANTIWDGSAVPPGAAASLG